ncbi:MAG: M1 family metallopeptidase [Lutibacter sp.]|jgi:hypothetical protein|nr:M1 family metallopeptidase [Lutibacter sp.]
MKRRLFLLLSLNLFLAWSQSPAGYWQQQVDYTMEIYMDVHNYQYEGTQQLVYTNQSPEALDRVFYHLYYNAFQPGSEMDVRLQHIPDPDGRMLREKTSAIAVLKPSETGFIKVETLLQEGVPVDFHVEGTILEVQLNQAIQPGEKTVLSMTFKGQVPQLIRRAGRNSPDGVALSMAQWYPKMAAYDHEGWHTDPYIAREFHGEWGDYDVSIRLDKSYTVAASGYLQNPQEIGHGYEDPQAVLKQPEGNELTWHFIAPKVHDFTWAADPEYRHDIRPTASGTTLHFFYKDDPSYTAAWQELQPYAEKALDYFNAAIGPYPWKQYSFIQGGDGGMEYAMCTLIDGGKHLSDIIGTAYHELAHAWFQHLLATNESKHAWMDEGFTSYIADKASNEILYAGSRSPVASYQRYYYVVNKGLEEPLTTHADRFNTNLAYGMASYTKGSIFLSQLGYVIGAENLQKTLQQYYRDFKFKHPTPTHFKRVAEKVSGIHLDWYLNEWTQTTHTIDYAVSGVAGTTITLSRIGTMPMPVDIRVEYTDGSVELFNIPLRMMRGEKPGEATVLKDWAWAYPTYAFTVSKQVRSVSIDPSGLMADIDQSNNTFTVKP